MELKECKVCGEGKPFSAYYCRTKGPRKGTPGSATCKDCDRARQRQSYEQNKEKAKQRNKANYEKHKAKRLSYQRDYREANLEKVKAKDRAYSKNNREKIRTTKAAYREKNREKINAYHNRWRKDRMKNDPAFRMNETVRVAVREALKKQGKVKGGRTFTALPYSSQDHIYPQSLLPYDSLDHPNFQKCWALDNLQPLEHIANIRKSNRVSPEGRRDR